ncbi:N-acetylglucosamine kinase [Umezawaea tangerina]|uniref:N-acetylglucosamine kinase-like BadF-type ATPase n=1 Tax=Umezawaea tangerina TaxID=84725 RepID=A0A2T0TLD2_9PSEU|nr:BadF/BadG/BcrA/BcrD ATPase family protein [Umezawaea tangerina]PRY46328.1 N-acetylglucosamine kinase-like BadF-type ATPase [Umezawaea tangerina]
MGFVVGLDAGGTATRAVVLDLDGTRLGAGVAGGANPNSHPPARAASQIGDALRAALEGLDVRKVQSGVLGMAGSSKLTDPAVAALFEKAWAEAGLRCPMRVVTDCEAAFAAGSASPDGTVVVAGTGSIAARIVDHKLRGTTGGYGWLLGDEGSAFWMGRSAVRDTLGQLETDEPLSALAEAVLGMSLVETAQRRRMWSRLITVVNSSPPIGLARYAPLVSAMAADQDPHALDIVDTAARLLADTAMAAREPGERTPIVLVGSLVGPSSPVGDRLRSLLRARTGATVRVATEGAAGAAWLAALDLLGPTAPRPA